MTDQEVQIVREAIGWIRDAKSLCKSPFYVSNALSEALFKLERLITEKKAERMDEIDALQAAERQRRVRR